MLPSRDEIERAAYDRWLRRQHHHGGDQDDWVAAERDLLFALNYVIPVRHRLTGPALELGPATARRCRFCERGDDETEFGPPALVIPPELMETTLSSRHECDACRSQFEETVVPHLVKLAQPFVQVPAVGRLTATPVYDLVERGSGQSRPAQDALHPRPSRDEPWPDPATGTTRCAWTSQPYIPMAAYKALARIAILIAPEIDLVYLNDTIEWTCNPDHHLDHGALDWPDAHVYFSPVPFPAPWISLARRGDDDAPYPYLILFLGGTRVVFQVALPYCSRDDEIEAGSRTLPRISLSGGEGPAFAASPCIRLPMGRPELRLNARLELAIAP